MITVLTVFGTRPEAIKLAPVVLAGRKQRQMDIVLCSSGQHREMCQSALAAFGLEPDIDLSIMRPGQTLTDITTSVLHELGPEIDRAKPDWLIVQGDTTTTFAAALAAFYRKVPVAHVEAGLRTGNIYAPWPEEVNRRLVSQLASLHFAPTPASAATLEREGVPKERVIVTGNTVVDALHDVLGRLRTDASLRRRASASLSRAGLNGVDEWWDLESAAAPLVLITCHRRESFGAPLVDICAAIRELAHRFPSRRFVYPLHPNPQLRATVDTLLRSGAPANLAVIEPLDYLPLVCLLAAAELVLTDSGGLQEECVSLGKRVVVMRQVTERAEGLETGLLRLAGSDGKLILGMVTEALTGAWAPVSSIPNPFGDGRAAQRILEALQAQPRQPAPMGEYGH